MSSQDNIIQKLQQLNEIPVGIAFNSPEIWNKLEDKLQSKRTSNKAWLRYAAIFILIMTGIVSYLLQTESPFERSTGTAINDQKDIQITESIITKNDQNADAEKIFIAKPKELKKKSAVNAEEVLPENKLTPEVPIVASSIRETIITTTSSIIEPVTNTNTTNTVAATSTTVKKPKLRIVHLNDLYKPDITEIAKAETRKQEAKEETQDMEPVIIAPPKPFWKSKASQRIAISLTDNP